MSATKYVIGIDFGTESGRAVLVEVATGKEVASSVYPYQNGVIAEPCLYREKPSTWTRIGLCRIPWIISARFSKPSRLCWPKRASTRRT